jgi:hypothetical protein
VEFGLRDPAIWNNGRYVGGTTSELYKQLRDEFLAAGENGLKLIPLFQTGSATSGHWGNIRNTNIGWQELPVGIPGGISTDVTAFAPDPHGIFGFDSSFNQLLGVVYSAFAGARAGGLSYQNLDYIHVGGDEPIRNNVSENRFYTLVGLCNRGYDKVWLQQNVPSSSSQEQVVALLGIYIRKKVEMIRNAGIRHGHTTTTLYYADMFDPGSLGNTSKLYSFNNLKATPTAQSIVNIRTSGLASNANVQAVRNSLILMQWNYDQNNFYSDSARYNTLATFNHFKANNLRFLHGNALADEGDPIFYGRVKQLSNQVVVSAFPTFKNFALGFVSYHWCSDTANIFSGKKGIFDQSPAYRTMEFLSHQLYYNSAIYD